MVGSFEDMTAPKGGVSTSVEQGDSMSRLLLSRAERFPDRMAVEDGEVALTYWELSDRVESFSCSLRNHCLAAGSTAVICLDRSADFIVALFAIWRLGAVAVPVDPATPRQRLSELLDDCDASLAIAPAGTDLSGLRVPVLQINGHGDAALTDPTRTDVAADDAMRTAYCLYTSGSTGRPKGVLISQASITHHATRCAAQFGLTPDDRCMQICSVGFDGSMLEICTAIAASACIVVYPAGKDVSSVALSTFVKNSNLSVVFLPTALWRIWTTEHAWTGEPFPSCLRMVMTGGEKIEKADFKAWRSLDAAGAPTLANLYGPTEATISATLWRYDIGDPFPDDAEVPIGVPHEGYRCHVVDDHLRPVPHGEIGELAIGGPGVATGYLNRPEETAAAFVPDPFTSSAGQRLYLTGDRVRLNERGLLEFVGRTDHQIKVLGHRVELGEVEGALREHPKIADAAVVVQEASGGKGLVAFCQARPGVAIEPAELRDWLSSWKPHYLVPRQIEILDALPIAVNGKVDRQALLRMANPEELPARGEELKTLHDKLAAIWKLTLGVESAAGEDNFFDVGGHSLLVAKFIWAITEATGVKLAYADIFANPTYAGIFSLIESGLNGKGGIEPANSRATEAVGEDWEPVTYQQRRLLRQARDDFATAVRVVPLMLEFRGLVDVPLLKKALVKTIDRHAVFHTEFRQTDSGIWQQRVKRAGAPDVECRTLRLDDNSAIDPRGIAQEIAGEWAFRGMDILSGELVRALILSNGADRTWLVVAFHHIVIDAQSIAIFIPELLGLYTRGTTSSLEEALYLEYAREQDQRRVSGAYEEDLKFWSEYLVGAEPVMLPRLASRDLEAPALPQRHIQAIENELLRHLRARSAAESTTAFALCLVALALVLADVTGQDDIIVGVPHHNRAGSKYRDSVGYFVNSMPVRIRLGGYESARHLLTAVQTHLEVAPARLGVSMADVDLPVKEGYSLPFQVMMVDEYVRTHHGIRGVSVEPVKLAAPFAKGDLNLVLSDDGERLQCGLVFDAALLDSNEVANWLAKFVALVTRLATAEDGLSSLEVNGLIRDLRMIGGD